MKPKNEKTSQQFKMEIFFGARLRPDRKKCLTTDFTLD